MKSLGQHFLKDASVLQKIAGSLELRPDDHIIEIGSGHGELTERLRTDSATAGHGTIKIVGLEKDSRLVEALQKRFASNSGDVDIIEGDALIVLPQIISKKSSEEHWKLAGNIPYYITGKLLRTIGELDHKPERSVLMVQREVAERICAEPPRMNRLAASIQFWANPKIIAQVPKESFSPPPEVDSAVILLKTKTAPQKLAAETYYEAVRALFSQPRKKILNNIPLNGRKKEEIENFIKKLGIDPGARPQNLTLEDIESIAGDNLWG